MCEDWLFTVRVFPWDNIYFHNSDFRLASVNQKRLCWALYWASWTYRDNTGGEVGGLLSPTCRHLGHSIRCFLTCEDLWFLFLWTTHSRQWYSDSHRTLSSLVPTSLYKRYPCSHSHYFVHQVGEGCSEEGFAVYSDGDHGLDPASRGHSMFHWCLDRQARPQGTHAVGLDWFSPQRPSHLDQHISGSTYFCHHDRYCITAPRLFFVLFCFLLAGMCCFWHTTLQGTSHHTLTFCAHATSNKLILDKNSAPWNGW